MLICEYISLEFSGLGLAAGCCGFGWLGGELGTGKGMEEDGIEE